MTLQIRLVLVSTIYVGIKSTYVGRYLANMLNRPSIYKLQVNFDNLSQISDLL